MRSRYFLGRLLPAVVLFAACPTRTIYYPDGGMGGSAGQAGGAGGMAGASGAGGGGGVPIGGAGGQAGTVGCNATSCPNGCCSDIGACVPYANETNDVCGTSGATCAPCATGSSCAVGAGICLGCTSGTVTTEASIGMAGGGSDRFGTSVAVRNGVMVVAAPKAIGGTGRAFAFSGSGTSYSFLQFVAPTGADPATYAQPLGMDRQGAAVVVGGVANGVATDWTFTRTGANWFAGTAVMPPEVNDSMNGVAIDAGTFVVGGLYGAYAYAGTGGPQTLAPSDYSPSSAAGFFGTPVAMSGDTMLIAGEPYDSAGSLGHFAYVFVKSAATWVQQAKLVPSDLATNSAPHFQFSVALDGSTAVLGTSSGAYVFVRTGSSWIQSQKISAPVAATNFGASVDLSGSAMVVGAISSNGGAGAAYVYGRSNGVWMAGPVLASNANDDGFGMSVAVDQGTVAIGAPYSTSDGAVYLFSCQPNR